MDDLLSNYFPNDLATVIKTCIALKIKVITDENYIVTLSTDGVVKIMSMSDSFNTIRTVTNIHNIFGSENASSGGWSRMTYILDNDNRLMAITGPASTTTFNSFSFDISHVTTNGYVTTYTTIQGDIHLSILEPNTIQLTYPTKVVATGLTGSYLYFLEITGIVKRYHSSTNWEEFDEEPELEDEMDKEYQVCDVVKFEAVASGIILLCLEHIIINTSIHGSSSRLCNNVVDVTISSDSLHSYILHNDGTIRFSSFYTPDWTGILSLQNVIAISSSITTIAFVTSEGQVLTNTDEDHPNSTDPKVIPQLQLEAKE